MPKHARTFVLILILAGCAAPVPHGGRKAPPAGAGAAGPAEPAPAAGAALFRIDASSSEIRLLVYRAGPLASVGHNHVIAMRPSRGWVAMAAPLADSRLYIELPPSSAVIDDASMRRQEGADFPGDIDDAAKSGTLHNMLSEALLNADRFPVIAIRADSVAGSAGDLRLRLRVSVAGRDSPIEVPATLEFAGGRMTASGRLDLKQSELGLTPFSIMLGALQVQDRMSVRFRIVARR